MSDNDNIIIRSLERIEAKTDKLHDEVTAITVKQEIHTHHLADYNESLREHMRRTQLLENRVDTLEKHTAQERLRESFIRRNWKMLATIAGIGSAIAGMIGTYFQIMGK